MSRALGAVGHIEGGYDTTRVPTAATAADRQRRAQRDADAIRYLTRRGHTDLLPILGLTTHDERQEAAS